MNTIEEVLSGTAKWCAIEGDNRLVLPTIPDGSIDAVVTDPIYAEVDRHYGRITEAQWEALMWDHVIPQTRRVLKPAGSAVFIIQPNSEKIGRMRGWVFRFMARVCAEWNMVQDAYWWNVSAQPCRHTWRETGLMRPSVKPCIWAGEPDCWRDQAAVLWTQSDSNAAKDRSDRVLRHHPSGNTSRVGRMSGTADERGGVTPFNLIPVANANSNRSAGSEGHGAGTPYDLAAWWTRYICPPGGVILDMFGGAGTMAEAARDQGRRCILIEQDPTSIPRIHATMARQPRGSEYRPPPPGQITFPGLT